MTKTSSKTKSGTTRKKSAKSELAVKDKGVTHIKKQTAKAQIVPRTTASSLDETIAKLIKENKLLRENLELQKKMQAVSKAAEGSDDPHMKNNLIPKPRGEAGRTGKNKEGYNLRRAMGMSHNRRLYNAVKVCLPALPKYIYMHIFILNPYLQHCVREKLIQLGAVNGTYRQQEDEDMAAVLCCVSFSLHCDIYSS